MRRILRRDNSPGDFSSRTILAGNNNRRPKGSSTLISDNNTNNNDQTPPRIHQEASCSSIYHSLQSVISSDSRDEDESTNTENVEENVNPIARLRSRRKHRPSSESSPFNPGAPLAAYGNNNSAPPPPPPPQEPSSHQVNKPQTRLSTDSQSKQQQQQHLQQTSSSTSENQQKALLSLLKEMRTLEQKLQQQTRDYTQEKSRLMTSLSQQSAHIHKLEQSNRELQKRNDTLNKALSGILTKLDRFATGCWQFSSSSVKKMSEALHIQVHEWGKLYQIDKSTDGMIMTSSSQEEQAMELVTMEKLQSMHYEIGELKRDNHDLKVQLKRMGSVSSKGGGRLGRKLDGGNSNDNTRTADDDGDEVSHFSGITQLTATTALTSTTTQKMDTMSGLLNHDNEKKVPSSPDPPQEVYDRKGNRVNVQTSSQLKTQPHKKMVQISSPRSILKQKSRYDQRFNEQRGVSMVRMQQQQDSMKPQRQQKPPMRKNDSGSRRRNRRYQKSYAAAECNDDDWGDEESEV